MSKTDAVVIASRALSVLLTVWALTEVSYLPEFLHSLLHYSDQSVQASASYTQYMHRYHLIRVGFLITRIVGYFLMARWFYKGGPEIEELLLPFAHGE
jgi:hypothetical protein